MRSFNSASESARVCRPPGVSCTDTVTVFGSSAPDAPVNEGFDFRIGDQDLLHLAFELRIPSLRVILDLRGCSGWAFRMQCPQFGSASVIFGFGAGQVERPFGCDTRRPQRQYFTEPND